MQRMKTATTEVLKDYFETTVNPLVEYIRKNWNWKGLKPKNFKKIVKSMNESDSDEWLTKSEKIEQTFKGLVDNYGCSTPFHERTSPWMVAFDQIDQGRDPLMVLIQSCVTWGAHLELEVSSRKIKDEEVKRVSQDKKFKELTSHHVSALVNQINQVLVTCDLPAEKHETVTRRLRQITEAMDTLVDL